MNRDRVKKLLAKFDGVSLSIELLHEIALEVIGPTSDGWVRKPPQRGIIAKKKFGSDSRFLAAEFLDLADQVRVVADDAAIHKLFYAAIFFHLRFENIHPLKDGNGRIGRLFLAEQCSRLTGVQVEHILEGFADCLTDYRSVFVTENDEIKIELLADLLNRVLGVQMGKVTIPFSLDVIFHEASVVLPKRSRQLKGSVFGQQ